MAVTKADLATRVAQRLRIVPSGQSLDVADSLLIQDAYDELFQWLLQRRAVTWGSSDDIPDQASRSMVRLLAYEVADDFLGNQDEGRIQRLRVDAYGPDGETGGAFGELIRMAGASYTPMQIEADYL
jgi:hypothetical protein